MKTCEQILTIASVACTIVECCSEDEATQLALLFNYLGATLSTLIAYGELYEKGKSEDDATTSDEEILFFGVEP